MDSRIVLEGTICKALLSWSPAAICWPYFFPCQYFRWGLQCRRSCQGEQSNTFAIKHRIKHRIKHLRRKKVSSYLFICLRFARFIHEELSIKPTTKVSPSDLAKCQVQLYQSGRIWSKESAKSHTNEVMQSKCRIGKCLHTVFQVLHMYCIVLPYYYRIKHISLIMESVCETFPHTNKRPRLQIVMVIMMIMVKYLVVAWYNHVELRWMATSIWAILQRVYLVLWCFLACCMHLCMLWWLCHGGLRQMISPSTTHQRPTCGAEPCHTSQSCFQSFNVHVEVWL